MNSQNLHLLSWLYSETKKLRKLDNIVYIMYIMRFVRVGASEL